TTYDESLKSLSPGFLMKAELIADAYAQSSWRVLEFYGRVMDWHLRWISHQRTLYHVNCHRGPWVLRARSSAGLISSIVRRRPSGASQPTLVEPVPSDHNSLGSQRSASGRGTQ